MKTLFFVFLAAFRLFAEARAAGTGESFGADMGNLSAGFAPQLPEPAYAVTRADAGVLPRNEEAAGPVSAEAKKTAAEFGLPELTVLITEKEAAEQNQLPTAAVPFGQALRAAMKSFLEDYSDEESPLSLLIDLVYEEAGENAFLPYSPEAVEKAKSRLKNILNRETAELSLLKPDEKAEHGESARENWIFFLWIPELSDHGHWAVVDRAGRKAVYNYGFN